MLFIAHLAVAGMLQPTLASACGFESPQAIALGSLNMNYPDAVHVLAAVWRAEDAGVLTPRRGQTTTTGALAFYRAASGVKALGADLAGSLATQPDTAMAIVLVPQVMWTRFEMGVAGLVIQSHAEGPLDGDLVIVTEEKVVRSLVDGKLGPAFAEQSGLLRFYGNDRDIEKMRAALAKIGEKN
ncbi:hypothetical protein ABMA32_00040 [Mesorhizobium sp. VNQ89]|uniref:hypothetical protein n=1 Tax=Mesorhizobium quangtriensis TaxID=3157709 RepID=UPI0032B7D10A